MIAPAHDTEPPAHTSTSSPLAPRRAVVILLAALVVTAVVFTAVAVIVLFVPWGREHPLPILATSLPVHGCLVLVSTHVLLRRGGARWRDLGFVRPTVRMWHMLWQVPGIFAALIATQLVMFTVLGRDPVPADNGVDTILGGVGGWAVVGAFVGIAVLAPLWEEALFRGVVHGGLRRRFGAIGSSVGSAALFAAAHGIPILLAYMFTLGLCLAYLREFHRTLWAPVLMHALLNGLVTGSIVLTILSG